jgi:hypothetical protein
VSGGALRELREALAYRPFAILLGLGIVVRAAVMVLYFPAVMLSFDSPRYARVDLPLFGDFWMPAGYPIFLKILQGLSAHLWVTIAVQHLLGLVGAVLLFTTAVRLGAPRWFACIPAGVVLLSGDHLYLEHIVMADTFALFTGIVALCAAVRGLVPAVTSPWLVVSGAFAGWSLLARSVGLVLVGVIPLCAALWEDSPLRRRLAAGAVTVVSALGVLGLYVGAWAASGGQYLGISDMRGWNLYARVGSFADCRKFKPPTGLRRLCDERPPAHRPGPFYYSWDPTAPARQMFHPIGPESGRRLEKFARRAIAAQPLDYAAAVIVDLIRYVDPAAGIERGYGGQPRELVSFGYHDPAVERIVVNALALRYVGVEPRVRGRQALDAYQALARVGGIALVVLMGLTVAGLVAGRGPLRLGVALFGLSSIGLYVLPTLTLSYDFRYGIPAETFLVMSGTLGAAALCQRYAGTLSAAASVR